MSPSFIHAETQSPTTAAASTFVHSTFSQQQASFHPDGHTQARLGQEKPHPPESQSQLITRLRSELRGVRTGIQRIVSGLQELGGDPAQGSDSTQNPDSNLRGMSSDNQYSTVTTNSTNSTNSTNHLSNGLQASSWASQSATSPARYFTPSVSAQQPSPPQHLDDLRARQRAFLESERSSPYVSSQNPIHAPPYSQRPRRTANDSNQPPYAVLGTREDLENPEYQSPVGAMFVRAWDRYRTAEETRRQAAVAEVGNSSPRELPAPILNPLVPHGHLSSISHSENANQFMSSLPPVRGNQHHSMQYPPPERRHQNLTAPPDFAGFNPTHLPHLHHQRFHHNAANLMSEYQPGLAGSDAPSRRLSRRTSRMTEAELSLHRMAPNIGSLNDSDYASYLQLQRSGLMGHTAQDSLDESENEERVIFDTQERPPPMKPEEMVTDMACKVCMEHLVNTVFLPCMHAVMCSWCAELEIPGRRGSPTIPKNRTAKCPVCRGRVKQKREIFLA